jgi:hypothetical protein
MSSLYANTLSFMELLSSSVVLYNQVKWILSAQLSLTFKGEPSQRVNVYAPWRRMVGDIVLFY